MRVSLHSRFYSNIKQNWLKLYILCSAGAALWLENGLFEKWKWTEQELERGRRGEGGIIDQKRHLLLFSSQSWAPDRIFQVWGLIVCWHFKFLGIFQKILLAEWLLTKCSVFIQWGPRQSAIYAFWLLGLCVDLRSQSAMCPGDWCLCLGN